MNKNAPRRAPGDVISERLQKFGREFQNLHKRDHSSEGTPRFAFESITVTFDVMKNYEIPFLKQNRI